jgi:DNA-binding transcriptional LysR family regulator
MVQLVQGGFGVATLPRSAVQRLAAFPHIRQLACDTALQPLPIHASFRADPSSSAVETVVRSALAFVEAKAPAGLPRRASSSKKSMSR